MAEEETPTSKRYERAPGNAMITEKTNLMTYEPDFKFFSELLKSSAKVVEDFEHRAKNQYKVKGKWETMTHKVYKEVYDQDEKGELILDEEGNAKLVGYQEVEEPIPPITNEMGIARFKLLLAQVSEHVATSVYTKEQAEEYIIDTLYDIGLILRINMRDYEISPKDLPLLASVLKHTIEACIYKALNGKTLDVMARQSTYVEQSTEPQHKKGGLRNMMKKLVGG